MIEDLSDLVNNPRETLEIELKNWVELKDPVVRANVARHMAALSNHGGGYLVFGIRDDLTIDPDRPLSLDEFNRDTFSAIVKKYLTPAFQCDVTIVTSATNGEFPIVRAPGHGVVPICVKQNGPHDANGKPQGIRAGVYYIRAPGPESIAISSPQDWSALIRRCTLNDRDALLKDMGHILRGQEAMVPTAEDRLQSWHRDAELRFHEALGVAKDFSRPVSLKDNSYQLSYLISHNDDAIPVGDLGRVLEEINNEVRDTVWTGWSMFYPFSPPEIRPSVHPDKLDGTGGDLLETNLLGFDADLPDFWRISPDGRASLVRGYREDVRLEEPGRWLSPETVLRETAELVRHARAFARRFPSASSVSFRCVWNGLKGREIRDFDPGICWSPGRIAIANQRTVSGEYPVVQLGASWPKIVSDLGCPILHLFGFTDCSPEFVEGMRHRFIKL